jgi:hypothetical protein
VSGKNSLRTTTGAGADFSPPQERRKNGKRKIGGKRYLFPIKTSS